MKRARVVSLASWMFGLAGTLAASLCALPSAWAGRAAPQPVEFFGCTALHDTGSGLACMLTPEDNLVVWVGGAWCDALQVSESGKDLAVERYSLQGGCQLRLKTGEPNLKITTLSITDRRSRKTLWSMPVDRSKPDLLKRRKHIWDRTEAELEEEAAELRRKSRESVDAETQIDIAFASALAQKRLGNLDLAIRELGQVTTYASSAKYPSIAFDSAYQRAYLLQKLGMHDEARTVLSGMARLASPGDSRSMTHQAWIAGLLDRSEDRIELAAERILGAVSAMERVHDREFQYVATPIVLELLVLLDHLQEAERLLDTFDPMLEGETDDCQRATLLTGAAFTSLILAQGQEPNQPGIHQKLSSHAGRGFFMRAMDSRLKCKETGSLANLYAGLANVELLEGRYVEAQGWLAKARSLQGRSVQTETGLLELEALIAIAAGKGEEGLRLFKALDELSRQTPGHFRKRIECRIVLGTLESLHLLGRQDSTVEQSVRACTPRAGNLLTPPELRQFTRRAKAAGLNIP